MITGIRNVPMVTLAMAAVFVVFSVSAAGSPRTVQPPLGFVTDETDPMGQVDRAPNERVLLCGVTDEGDPMGIAGCSATVTDDGDPMKSTGAEARASFLRWLGTALEALTFLPRAAAN